MKYVYDSDSDALYVTLRNGAIDHTVELTDGVVLDVSADDEVIGVDVMVPSQGWDADIVADRARLDHGARASLRTLAAANWPSVVR
ncbi:MAG TPA: DUF2283 domain-containing protein [Acidimicrobiales bacterium]|nr:DUF2283 domain-containing protein [Acidimicrobiales bacterium]